MGMNEVPGLMVLGLAALSAAGGPPQAQGTQQPTFRGGTGLIVIDVNVVARKDGSPIEGLKPNQFVVTIDGKPRAIESIEFVRSASPPGGRPAGPAATLATSVPAAPVRDGRVILMAIDQASFPVTAQASAREAATRVVDSVSPGDYLGMVAFPGAIEIAPTRNHGEIRKAIGGITGQRIEIASSRFNISASEASLLKSRDQSGNDVVRRECARETGNVMCPAEVRAEGARIADLLESQALQSIVGLRGVLDGMKEVPGRKTLLVVSAGIPTSSRPSGRPNVNIETDDIGRRAAAANVSLYVLYMNIHFLRAFSAESGRLNLAVFQDIALFSQGLERFSDTAGGRFFQVEVNADPFVARAMRETAATYVLTVQATPAERDGKEHIIEVKALKVRDADIRYRRFVVVPKVQSSKFRRALARRYRRHRALVIRGSTQLFDTRSDLRRDR
jgi:VWFA-related protein